VRTSAWKTSQTNGARISEDSGPISGIVSAKPWKSPRTSVSTAGPASYS
jgi:hypothetical protein